MSEALSAGGRSETAVREARTLTTALAWRNLWRNRRRTWLTAGGIGFAVFLVVLAQAFRSTRLVSGQVEMVIEGLQAGEPARLGLTELAPESDASRIAYSFRYFQDLKAEIVIPDGFEPERVHVIVRVKGKNSKTVEDFFVWEVKSG